MTEREAIEELKYDCNELGKAIPCDTSWGSSFENAYGMAIQALEKLAEYEDLEEQGRLIKLPCKVGDDVWFVPSQANYKLNILNHYSKANRVYHQKVAKITFSVNGWYLECDKDLEYATGHIFIDKMYKETWFLTKSEAEAKLEELRGGE